MSNTGSDPTRPQTTGADTEDVGTGDKLLASSTSRTPTGSDVNVGIEEEVSPSSAEDQATTRAGGDTENCTPWNLAERIWRLMDDTHHGGFTRLDFVLGIVGIIIYIVDIATDLQLAISYFLGGHVAYGVLTTVCIFWAYFCVLVCGLCLFDRNKKVPTAWWVCRIVFLILGLSPVIAMVETMYYGMKSRARHREGEREDNCYTVTAKWTVYQRFTEGFLEAAPQLCFQLYITFKEKPDDDVAAGMLPAMT
ncbi:hypothetical protein BaRGS_00040349, partial [Batillaria attramentaria]